MMVHQGANRINQHINYPFVTNDILKQYIDAIHAKDMKIKIYYTIRELSNYTAEIWALRSLGDEIYLDGPGFRLADQFDAGKNEWKAARCDRPAASWLVEHLARNYVPAWHQPLGNGHCDAAIATQGLSRWHNYYLEGLAWLIREQDIDGLYLDGVGFDREIMKRMRKVMNRAKPGCLIDFHQGNNYPKEYGWNNPASVYMELFPYLDSLWFGEGFDYNEPPDYWLVEMSGIPYGLTGEMLQDGGNPWRGMLYGMTNRLPLVRRSAGDLESLGRFRHRQVPHDRLLGSVLSGEDRSRRHPRHSLRSRETNADLCGELGAEKETIKLQIDWKALGLDPEKTKFVAPEIAKFQSAAEFSPTAEIPVEPGKGWLLILREK